ncbi:hypothetical protein [Fangia hongkongensis]|uniref:hypothetical protein n=1 Tax=Fangia hongkongensis TaxID=270495 RepID=UPI00036A57A2|nr:hypothetical protein [Fangia hongkongensis]MBK2124843.1 hypothetical protein [Fangia hongkongensis]
MTAERKNLKSDIDTLDRILDLINFKKDVFIDNSSENDLKKIIDYVNKTKAKIDTKRQSLPIGHRFTGTFYLKKPYTIPSEAVEIEGSAFIPEHLVSWKIESDDEYAKNLYYVRAIYKDKAMRVPLTREDGEAVFDEKSEVKNEP